MLRKQLLGAVASIALVVGGCSERQDSQPASTFGNDVISEVADEIADPAAGGITPEAAAQMSEKAEELQPQQAEELEEARREAQEDLTQNGAKMPEEVRDLVEDCLTNSNATEVAENKSLAKKCNEAEEALSKAAEDNPELSGSDEVFKRFTQAVLLMAGLVAAASGNYAAAAYFFSLALSGDEGNGEEENSEGGNGEENGVVAAIEEEGSWTTLEGDDPNGYAVRVDQGRENIVISKGSEFYRLKIDPANPSIQSRDLNVCKFEVAVRPDGVVRLSAESGDGTGCPPFSIIQEGPSSEDTRISEGGGS